MQEQVDNERPGHVWKAIDGEVVYEEDVAASEMLGRPLNEQEMVVHKDGNPRNNRPNNLKIIAIEKLDAE